MSSDVPLLTFPTRYLRSIHIQHDFARDRLGMHGYKVTPLVLQTTEQVMTGLSPDSTMRAFSLIGPYGSGKSAYGLFLAHYLQEDTAVRRRLLLEQGLESIPEAMLEGPALVPTLVSGNNTSLRSAVLSTFQRTLDTMPELCDRRLRLPRVIAEAANETMIDPQRVAELVGEASTLIAEHTSFGGLVLIIDELGQFLDFAARQHSERDLFVLQTLAEMAARSGRIPFIVVTILHQSFERYAATAGTTRRIEWAKVQGRFVELPFQEPPTQMLRLVSSALTPAKDDPFAQARHQWAADVVPETEQLGLRPAELAVEEWVRVVAGAFPLHPMVLLALPLLFRQLAQNERSLFAFLTSGEPWSVQDFLRSASTADLTPIYRLPHLYAYISATLGPSLFGRARGQRWAELAEMCAQFPDSDGLLRDVLTTIGTLGALGQVRGLRASRAQVVFALRGQYTEAAIEHALHDLEARKHITYRQHRESFVIWEGSDLDIDALIRAARHTIGNRTVLTDLLRQHADLAPIIARRHSYRTGSVRYFIVRFVEVAALKDDLAISTQADGEILYVVPSDEEALDAAYLWAIEPARVQELQRIIVLPNQAQELRDILLDVAALQYVLLDQQELEHDRAARREVSSRLTEAQQVLAQTIAENYGPGISQWFWRSSSVPVRTTRQIDDLLSDVCDETYHLAPHIWNELIVRRQPSSAAAKARRNLIEAMLEHPHEELLAITGYPPERAIYASVLQNSNLHRREEDGVWRFGPPPVADIFHLHPTWEAIQAFLDSTEAQERPIVELFQMLEMPPYGIKSGVIPLLFMAVLITNAGEITVYEHNNYVKLPDIATFERLFRKPDNFAIRRSRISGIRNAVYQHVARVLAPDILEHNGQPAVLGAVTPLLRFVHTLPEYSRATKQVSQRAQAIRKAILEAKAPDILLFTQLPLACNLQPFSPDISAESQTLKLFFDELRTGLQELETAYGLLVQHVRKQIRSAFGALATESEPLRIELLVRYQHVAESNADMQLRAFGVRLEHADDGSDAWVKSVGALIGRKPLDAWSDETAQQFELQVRDWGRRFRNIEQIVAVSSTSKSPLPMVRVSIANSQGEQSAVLQTNYSNDTMSALRNDLEQVLIQYGNLTLEQRTYVLTSLLEPLLTQSMNGKNH